MSEHEDRGGEKAPYQPQPVSMLEKIATTMSALLIAGLIGVLVWDAVHPNAAATFQTTIRSVVRSGPSYRAAVAVRNVGDEAAKSVVVHLELVDAAKDTVLAETDVTVDWLPGRSSRELVGFFARPGADRDAIAVRASVRGYVIP